MNNQSTEVKVSSHIMGKREVLLILSLLIFISLTSLSFSLSFEYVDRYGTSTPSLVHMYGTFTDKIVFVNEGDFDIYLNSYFTTEDELICVEWNNYENEGGDFSTFEPDYCWVDEDLTGGEITQLIDLAEFNYGITPDEVDLFDVLNFTMEDTTAHYVYTWFVSFSTQYNGSEYIDNVENQDAITWYTIDQRTFDCDGVRDNNFDLEGYTRDSDGDRVWINVYTALCLTMEDVSGNFYYNFPLYLSSGEIQCSENQDDNPISTAYGSIYANDFNAKHPCTINDDVDLDASSPVGTCSYIDIDECESGICNPYNRCGSCDFVDFEMISNTTDDDTDDNFILLNGDYIGLKATWEQHNTDRDPDCIVIEIGGDKYTLGNNSYPSCITPGSPHGDLTDSLFYETIDYTTKSVTATIRDSTCGDTFIHNFNIKWTDITIDNFDIDYDYKDEYNYQLRQDTNEINYTLTIDEDYTYYSCSITATGEVPLTQTYSGDWLSSEDALCILDTDTYFSTTSEPLDNITTTLTAKLDDDVFTSITTSVDSLSYYDPFSGFIGVNPLLNYGLDFDVQYPAFCEYGNPCVVSDNNNHTQLGSYNDNVNFFTYAKSIDTVRIRYYNDETGYLHRTNTVHLGGTDSLYSTYSWNFQNNFSFPTGATGYYDGRIEVCYEFSGSLLNNVWWCDDTVVPVVIPVNTLVGVLRVYNSSDDWVDNGYIHTKYETLKFCNDKSIVGANNTNVYTSIDYEGDGIIDYNLTYPGCIVKNYLIDDASPFYTAQGQMHSDERDDDSVFQFRYIVNGVCGDYYSDWNEYGIDNSSATSGWSEVCWGNCYDNILNGNENQSDYGGRCGQCVENSLKGNDLDWLILHDTNYLYFPFEEQQCIEVQGASGGFLFIIILAFMVLILLFVPSLFIIITVLIYLLFGFRIKFNPFNMILNIFFGKKRK